METSGFRRAPLEGPVQEQPRSPADALFALRKPSDSSLTTRQTMEEPTRPTPVTALSPLAGNDEGLSAVRRPSFENAASPRPIMEQLVPSQSAVRDPVQPARPSLAPTSLSDNGDGLSAAKRPSFENTPPPRLVSAASGAPAAGEGFPGLKISSFGNPTAPGAPEARVGEAAAQSDPAAGKADGFSALKQHLVAITSQIEALSDIGAPQLSAAAIHGELAQIRSVIATALPRRAIEVIDGKIAVVRRRIEGARGRVRGDILKDIEQTLAQIGEMLGSLAPAEQLAGADREIVELGASVDRILANKSDVGSLRKLEGDVAGLRQLVSHVACRETLHQLEENVDLLSATVGEIIRAAGGGDAPVTGERPLEVQPSVSQMIRSAPAAPAPAPAGLIVEHVDDMGRNAGPNAGPMAPVPGVRPQQPNRAAPDQAAAEDGREKGARGAMDSLVDLVARETGQQRGVRSSPSNEGLDLLNLRAAKEGPVVHGDHSTDAGQSDDQGEVNAAVERIAQQLRNAGASRPGVFRDPAVQEALNPVGASDNASANSPLSRGTGRPKRGKATSGFQEGLPNPFLDRSTEVDVFASLFEPNQEARAEFSAAAEPAQAWGLEPIVTLEEPAQEAPPNPRMRSGGGMGSPEPMNAPRRGREMPKMRPPDQRREMRLPPLRQKAKRRRSSTGAGMGIFLAMTGLLVLGGVGTTVYALQARWNVPALNAPTAPIDAAMKTDVRPVSTGTQSAEFGNPQSVPEPDLQPQPAVDANLQPTPEDRTGSTGGNPGETRALSSPGQDIHRVALNSDFPVVQMHTTLSKAPVPETERLPDAIGGHGLRAAALRGDPAGVYEVGLRFAQGKSVPQNYPEAARWFRWAQQAGVVPAAFQLGVLFEKGQGVLKDPERARAYYLEAAERGNAAAMHNLAVLEADRGNPTSAAQWFIKAANCGVTDSQFNLAVLYFRGVGVKVDLGESYKWFSLAAARGDRDAMDRRNDVAMRLSDVELARAEQAIKNFVVEPQPDEAFSVPGPVGGWDATAVKTPGPTAPTAPPPPVATVH